MTNGTYAEALNAGFNKTQATFFSKFSIDLKDETAERLREEVDAIRMQLTLKNRIANRLRKLADWLAK